MKNYYFYFDESFHTRIITKGSFNDTNFFNYYISTGIGFEKKNKHYILNEYQKQGIGKGFFEIARKQVKEAGIKK